MYESIKRYSIENYVFVDWNKFLIELEPIEIIEE
jgi:hypothetical protein